jgi:hypothetical protein
VSLLPQGLDGLRRHLVDIEATKGSELAHAPLVDQARPVQPAGGFMHFPEEGPVEIYYYWERDDLPRDAVGQSSFLPADSVEEAIEDAEIDLDGWTVRCRLTVEEGRALH